MTDNVPAAGSQEVRILAEGKGWHVREVICSAGPSDRAFEERHVHYSIAAVMTGTFTYRSAHGEELMTPGSLLLGNAGACFKCGHEHAAGDRCVAFHIEQELMEDIARGLSGVRSLEFPRHRIPAVNELARFIDRVSASVDDPLALEQLALNAGAHAIAHSRALTGTDRMSATSRDIRRITDAIHFIERNFGEDIRLETMAKRFRLSRFHFLRLFRKTAGATPHQFLIRTRMRAAAAQLRTSSSDVLNIALACGFADLSDFTRRFGRLFGVTPAEYRRLHRGSGRRRGREA